MNGNPTIVCIIRSVGPNIHCLLLPSVSWSYHYYVDRLTTCSRVWLTRPKTKANQAVGLLMVLLCFVGWVDLDSIISTKNAKSSVALIEVIIQEVKCLILINHNYRTFIFWSSALFCSLVGAILALHKLPGYILDILQVV